MTSHLWPARRDYLRRGTPVLPRQIRAGDDPYDDRSVLVDFEGDSEAVIAMRRPDLPVECFLWSVSSLFIDLRDPTARAHAAWPYTGFREGCFRDCPEIGRSLTELRLRAGSTFASARAAAMWWEARAHVLTLRCMSAGDKTVTIAEVRRALAWAESVVALGGEE